MCCKGVSNYYVIKRYVDRKKEFFPLAKCWSCDKAHPGYLLVRTNEQCGCISSHAYLGIAASKHIQFR